MGDVKVYSEDNSHVYDIILSHSFITRATIAANKPSALLSTGLEISFSTENGLTNSIHSASSIANPLRICLIDYTSQVSIEVKLTNT